MTAWFVFVTFFGLPMFMEDDDCTTECTTELGTAFLAKEDCERFVDIRNTWAADQMEFFCVEMPALELSE